MIRGAVHRVDLGTAKRGHEQRGRRLGLVLSISDLAWSIVTIVPTSTSAQDAIFRPRLEIAGESTLALVDQIRSIDTRYIQGDPMAYLNRDEMAEVGQAVTYYFGLLT